MFIVSVMYIYVGLFKHYSMKIELHLICLFWEMCSRFFCEGLFWCLTTSGFSKAHCTVFLFLTLICSSCYFKAIALLPLELFILQIFYSLCYQFTCREIRIDPIKKKFMWFCCLLPLHGKIQLLMQKWVLKFSPARSLILCTVSLI